MVPYLTAVGLDLLTIAPLHLHADGAGLGAAHRCVWAGPVRIDNDDVLEGA